MSTRNFQPVLHRLHPLQPVQNKMCPSLTILLMTHHLYLLSTNRQTGGGNRLALARKAQHGHFPQAPRGGVKTAQPAGYRGMDQA